MTQLLLQPYRKLENQHIQQLAKGGNFYWVSQSYKRAQTELDHTKTPILFSAYKELKEANVHYQKVKGDKLAALMDIRRTSVTARLVNLCNGNTDFVPFISLTFNQRYLDNFIAHHYRDKYRAWIRKNRPDWIIKEHNAVDAHFETLMGEPMVKITYGKQFVMVRLEDLEKI